MIAQNVCSPIIQGRQAMKIAGATALGLLSGVAIGAVGVHSLHAQAKPPVYVVADNEVTDEEQLH
jgi:hypothetical protein